MPAIVQSKFIRELGFHVRASYPCLYVVTDEPDRLVQETQLLADSYLSKEAKTESKFNVYRWTITDGWICKGKKIPLKTAEGDTQPNNPISAFAMIRELEPFSIFLMENFHFYLTKEDRKSVV